MRKLWVLLLIVLVANAGVTSRAFGEAKPEAQTSGAAKDTSVKPEDVMRQMADYLGKLPAFSCKVESVLELTGDQAQKEAPAVTKMTVRLERPNKVAFIIDEGVMGLTVVSDGKQLTQYLPMMKRYTTKEAPADFTGVTDIGVPVPLTMLGMADAVIPANPDDFYKALMSGVTESKYFGKEKIGEVECHHCRFTQNDFDWDIWVETGKRPVPHKIQPDFAKQLAKMGGNANSMKLSYVVTLTDWNVAPKFTDVDFKFVPPAGAQKAEMLIDTPEEPVHELLGKPAPSFDTTDLEGKAVSLKAHLGKKVILLDFWATWCGPCVQAMPQVDEAAKKFADKGLVFYAVNAGEEAAAIKEFLTNAKLEVPVVLDLSNEIGQAYKVEGIPQTLLIGKDGKVQVVHVGFNGQLGKLLTKEIESLLAGKDLASETLAKAEESQKKHEAAEAESKAAAEAATNEAAKQKNEPAEKAQ